MFKLKFTYNYEMLNLNLVKMFNLITSIWSNELRLCLCIKKFIILLPFSCNKSCYCLFLGYLLDFGSPALYTTAKNETNVHMILWSDAVFLVRKYSFFVLFFYFFLKLLSVSIIIILVKKKYHYHCIILSSSFFC
jgi:hypothetical protein